MIDPVIRTQQQNIEGLRRVHGVGIEIDQTQDPATITIDGKALAVDDAAVTIRELINRVHPNLRTPETARPRSGRPEGPGSFDTAPSFVLELCTARPLFGSSI